MITSVFSLKLCKKTVDNKKLYICGCIWYNTWCWTYSVNWEHMRMIFYLIRILAACKNPKNHWANKFCFNFCLFLLYLKLLSWNLHFYSVFLLLTKFLYERRWWSIFSKVPDRKPLFLLNIKIKQNPRCPNKQYNVVFIENFAIFPLLNLEMVFPALKLTRNCYLKWTFFSWKLVI